MSIRAKFLFSAAAVVVLLVAFLSGGLLTLLGAQRNAEERRQEARALVGDVFETSHWWNKTEDEIQTQLLLGEGASRLDQIRDAARAFEEGLARMESRKPDSPELAPLRSGRALLRGFLQEAEAVLAAGEDPDTTTGRLLALLRERIGQLHQLDNSIEEALEALWAQVVEAEDLAVARVERALRFVEYFGFSIAGLVILVIAGQFVVMIRPIIRSLLKVVHGISQVGAGNLGYRLDIRTGDEIEHLSHEINRMATNLSTSYQQLEAARDETEAYSMALKAELEKGRQLQQDFLPEALPRTPGWELAASLSPARDVSGDFYDAFVLPDGMLGLAIGDVCDKGVGSALFMALSRSLLRVFSGQGHLEGNKPSPALPSEEAASMAPGADGEARLLAAVTRTNEYIAVTHSETNMFTTLFVGFLDPVSGSLTYINGGHEAPAIIRPDGEIARRLHPTGPAVGLFADVTFEVGHTILKPGDTLFAYTDGVTDAQNGKGERFSEGQLLGMLATPASSAQERLRAVESRVRAHIAEAVQFDDITLLLASRDPSPAD